MLVVNVGDVSDGVMVVMVVVVVQPLVVVV